MPVLCLGVEDNERRNVFPTFPQSRFYPSSNDVDPIQGQQTPGELEAVVATANKSQPNSPRSDSDNGSDNEYDNELFHSDSESNVATPRSENKASEEAAEVKAASPIVEPESGSDNEYDGQFESYTPSSRSSSSGSEASGSLTARSSTFSNDNPEQAATAAESATPAVSPREILTQEQIDELNARANMFDGMGEPQSDPEENGVSVAEAIRMAEEALEVAGWQEIFPDPTARSSWEPAPERGATQTVAEEGSMGEVLEEEAVKMPAASSPDLEFDDADLRKIFESHFGGNGNKAIATNSKMNQRKRPNAEAQTSFVAATKKSAETNQKLWGKQKKARIQKAKEDKESSKESKPGIQKIGFVYFGGIRVPAYLINNTVHIVYGNKVLPPHLVIGINLDKVTYTKKDTKKLQSLYGVTISGRPATAPTRSSYAQSRPATAPAGSKGVDFVLKQQFRGK